MYVLVHYIYISHSIGDHARISVAHILSRTSTLCMLGRMELVGCGKCVVVQHMGCAVGRQLSGGEGCEGDVL